MLIIIALFAWTAHASPLVITEKTLASMAQNSSPELSKIQAQLLSSVTQGHALNEKYGPELYGRGSYAETQERPIIAFLPVFSPLKQAQLGVRQKFKKGFEAQLQVSTDQRSANSAVSGKYRDVTTNILSLTVQMDLWKDLFGALSEAELNQSAVAVKQAKIEEDISKKALLITVRRLFWNLVANSEQTRIAARLEEDAKKQLADSRRRLSKSIGDTGDVARYEAQLAQRRGQLLLLSYQKESLLKTLKTLLPDLGGKEITVKGYDIDQTIKAVFTCAQVITGAPKVPWTFTRYDEVLELLKEQKSLQRNINKRYSDVDL